VEREDYLKLSFIRTKLADIQEISIIMNDYTISDEALLDIFKCLFWKNNSLEKIYLGGNMEGLLEKSLLYLAENVLSTSQNLQKFFISLSKYKITNKALRSLIERISQLAENLTSLSFDCRCPDADADSLRKLFVSMPNLKSFGYQTLSNAFDDEVLKSFISNTLPSLKKLTAFQLFLPNSKITDSSVKKLLNSFPNEWLLTLDLFEVNFCNTKITEESLKVFIYETVAKFQVLESFNLNTNGSLVNADLEAKISRWTKILSED